MTKAIEKIMFLCLFFLNLFNVSDQVQQEGLFFSSLRFYDSKLGRFLQSDEMIPSPTGRAMSRLTYAYNNPMKYSDPSGHVPLAQDPDEGPIEKVLLDLLDMGADTIDYAIDGLAIFQINESKAVLDDPQASVGEKIEAVAWPVLGALTPGGKKPSVKKSNAGGHGWRALGAGRGGYHRRGINANDRRGHVGRKSNAKVAFFRNAGITRTAFMKIKGVEELSFAFADSGFIGSGAMVKVKYVPTTFFTTGESVVFVRDTKRKVSFSALLNGDGSVHELYFGNFDKRPWPDSFDYEFKLTKRGENLYSQSNPPKTFGEGLGMVDGQPTFDIHVHPDTGFVTTSIPPSRGPGKHWELQHIDHTQYTDTNIPVGAYPSAGHYRRLNSGRANKSAVVSDFD